MPLRLTAHKFKTPETISTIFDTLQSRFIIAAKYLYFVGMFEYFRDRIFEYYFFRTGPSPNDA